MSDGDPDWQAMIDAAYEGKFDEIPALLAAYVTSPPSPEEEHAWHALDLMLIDAWAALQQRDRDRGRAQLARVVTMLDGDELPFSPRDFIFTHEQAGIVACCAGDFALAERVFAKSEDMIARWHRVATVNDLVRNAYDRALCCKLAGREAEADAHVSLASQLAELVYRAYEGGHPEHKDVRKLTETKGAEAARELPFWFHIGNVPQRRPIPG
jgi:hypothetical protein